jgi:aspartate/methionine/tyrosine aminotransferase
VFALPSDDGDPQLREALALFFNTYFHPIHRVTPDNIVLTAGASDAIENVIHAVCDDGDSVLVPGPSWRKSRDQPLIAYCSGTDMMKSRWLLSHAQSQSKC